MSTVSGLTTVRVAVNTGVWTAMVIPAGAISPQLSIENQVHPWVVNSANSGAVTQGFFPGAATAYTQLSGNTIVADTTIYVNPNGGNTFAVLIYGT